MSFERDRLPDVVSYFEAEGLRLSGAPRAKWKTTECKFHGGSDSMRINVAKGAWVCMSCGEKGGDVLAYHMRMHCIEFVEAAKALGAWIDDGKPYSRVLPTALSPRAALEVLEFESTVVAVAAGNLANGRALTDIDLKRLIACTARIHRIVEDFS